MAKKCPPFCDSRKTCPDHHDLLVAMINCSDQRDELRQNLEPLENAVKTMLKKGWRKDDDVPDPVKNYRFPLLHWAAVLGKCRAIEWMKKNGFSLTVHSSETGETALHRCVLCLHYAGVRRLCQKIGQLVALLKDCLPLQDKGLQTPLHAAALRLIKGNKSDFYEDFLEMMVAKAKEMPGKTADVLNVRDKSGNTAMHYLAQTDLGFVALRAIVQAGADVTLKNKENFTPLDIAVNCGSSRIVKSLSTAGKFTHASSRYDTNIFTTDSPPESPNNRLSGVDGVENDGGSDDLDETESCQSQNDADPPQVPDTAVKGSADHAPTMTDTVLPEIATAESCPLDNGLAENHADMPKTVDTPSASVNMEETSTTSSTLENCSKSISTEAKAPSTEEAAATCSTNVNHEEAIHALVTSPSRGIQVTGISPYSCIIHVKKERVSFITESCEQCGQDPIGNRFLSDCNALPSHQLESSMVNLLRGAGLLDNLAELAEKTRVENEHILTEKLEQVQETNSSLETSATEITTKNEEIKRKLKEVEELKQQLSEASGKQEQLFLKRKRLNEECTALQKKLHCCDSLLKVVPRVNLDDSNS